MKPQNFPGTLRPLPLCVAMALLGGAPLTAAAAGTPYSGSAISLPATFEAENFDKGGEGSGYRDLTSANTGGQYRTSEGVDIIAAGGNFAVNSFQNGEWMAYTVNVPAAGTYDIAVHASNNMATAGAFHIEVDGVNVTGSVAVPRTGSWDTFNWFGKTAIPLTPGQHVIRLVADTQYFNVNALRVLANTLAPVPAPGAAGQPYQGAPIALPGSFEAEHFDKGGQGAGYHDLSAGNLGGQLRTGEGVDIIASADSAGGGHVVNNFQTGEWLAYTVNVPAAGKYDLAIRASNNGTPAAFHIEVDGVNVTGPVPVPKTGGWEVFDWFGKTGIALAAGQHVIKLVSDTQYFNVNTLRVQAGAATSTPGGSAGTPYGGTPITVPLAFEAENFDKGGEGRGYHDLTAGNAGGQYRTSEAVDIVASTDSAGGGYVVNTFHTGEWLAYTINVPATGKYDLSIRASNNGTPGAYHFEVDGVDVTGRISVPNTGSWDSFAWFGKQGVNLTAGKRVLKLVADTQYFNVNSIGVLAGGTATPPPSAGSGSDSSGSSGGSGSIPSAGVAWSCDFENSYCSMGEHSKMESSGGRRSSFVSTARSNAAAVKLTTQPGDNNIHGSGDWERNDLMMSPSSSYCNQGQVEWWGHSVMFPSDYVFPTSGGGIVFDFHHNSSSGQANFEIQTMPGVGMRLRGYGGSSINNGQYEAVVTDPYGAKNGVTRNKWYDFNYHVKWSSGSDGYMIAWLNGKKVMNYNGPTLYKGISCYLKLANYHSPFGQASSVIHDRIVRGSSAAAVSLWTLE